MKPTTPNLYKTMNRGGFFINLCVHHCNEELVSRFETVNLTSKERNDIIEEVQNVLAPAISVLREKYIASPSGADAITLKLLKRNWEDIPWSCKRRWMEIIYNSVSYHDGTENAGPKLSKHRVLSFQKETGILALNRFYEGYMNIASKWKVSVEEMVADMSRLNYNKKLLVPEVSVDEIVPDMSRLNFNKKLLDHEQSVVVQRPRPGAFMDSSSSWLAHGFTSNICN